MCLQWGFFCKGLGAIRAKIGPTSDVDKTILNEVETRHHLILIRLYFILTILITEDDHIHIVFDWIKIIAV
jgi:hypothetical protein